MSKIISMLKPEQQKRFDILERVAIAGRAIFFMAGQALDEIKRERFYESKGFARFEDYCESIGYTKRHCNRLIVDAAVIKDLPENLRNLVQSEFAARELNKISPALRPAVLIAASGGEEKPASAADIRKLAPPARPIVPADKPHVAQASAPPPRKAPAKASGKPASGPKDGTGLEIPKEVQPLWDRMPDAQELITYISTVRSLLKKAQEDKDPLFVEVDFTDNIAKLNQIFVDLNRAKPFAVCPSCAGKLSKGCATCKGRGFVSEFYWKHNVPEDLKETTGRK